MCFFMMYFCQSKAYLYLKTNLEVKEYCEGQNLAKYSNGSLLKND